MSFLKICAIALMLAIAPAINSNAIAGAADPLFVNATTDDGHRATMALTFSQHQLERKHPVKGAMLLRHWLDDPHRPTRDLDLLGFGESDPQLNLGFFKEILLMLSR